MTKTMNVWQPYAQMGAMSEDETVIVRGEGSYIYTDSGEKLFDSSAALWYANLGHGNRELAEAAYRQMLELETYYIWAGMLHPRVVELADVLTADGIAPIPNAKVMFGAGGSDSADIAFKLARLHWQLQGRPEKRAILHRTHAYHGLHAFGTSVNGESEVREMFGPTTLVPETGIIDFENIDLVREQVLALGPETIAAIVAEPIIGAGGVYPPAPGYLPGLRQLCDEFDILLIFDEVITGFGRVGEWFAAHRYQVTPDLLMFAKGITSGYQPLGGVYAGPRVWEPFWNKEAGHKFAFGTTYSGHATGCAVALKTIEILARDGHLERVKQLERRLGDGLRDHVAHLPTIESVRHEGLMASVNFNSSLDVEVLRGRMRKRGIHTRAAGDGIAISPPFITTDAEMDELIHVLAEEASYV